jgi:hypothetical protein
MPNSWASSLLVCSPASCRRTSSASCCGLSFGCLPRSRPFARATFIPLPGAHPDQIGLELGDHRQHVEQQPPDRIGRVCTEPPRLSFTWRLVSSSAIVRVGRRPRQPVELGHHQRVAGAARRERFAQVGPVAVGTVHGRTTSRSTTRVPEGAGARPGGFSLVPLTCRSRSGPLVVNAPIDHRSPPKCGPSPRGPCPARSASHRCRLRLSIQPRLPRRSGCRRARSRVLSLRNT